MHFTSNKKKKILCTLAKGRCPVFVLIKHSTVYFFTMKQYDTRGRAAVDTAVNQSQELTARYCFHKALLCNGKVTFWTQTDQMLCLFLLYKEK